MILVDTNVLIDIAVDDPRWSDWAGLRLLTRDPRRYREYFPTVALICPK